jgi:hypothetical protein
VVLPPSTVRPYVMHVVVTWSWNHSIVARIHHPWHWLHVHLMTGCDVGRGVGEGGKGRGAGEGGR